MQETLASKSSDNLELYFDDNNFAQILYGELNKNLKEIEKRKKEEETSAQYFF